MVNVGALSLMNSISKLPQVHKNIFKKKASLSEKARKGEHKRVQGT